MTAATLPKPTQRAYPVLGHAMEMLKRPLEFVQSLRELGDVVQIKLGSKPAYVVNHPDLMRQILVVDAKKFNKGVHFDKMRPILGNGLVTSEGDTHRRNRRLVQPAFHHQRIEGYVQIMSERAQAMSASLHSGERVPLDDLMRTLALEIVAKALFTTELGDKVVAECLRSFPVLVKGIVKRALSPFPVMEKLPTPENRRFEIATNRVNAVVDEIIADYRASGADHGDLVSMLLLAKDADTGESLTDREVRDEVMTMFAAGFETVSNTMAFLWHAVGQHAEIEAKLHAEAAEVLAGRPVALADVPKLEYTRRVFTETLRMYTPAWMHSRRAIVEVQVGDALIPAGATVLFSPYALQHDERYFPDPENFDPDRWLRDETKQLPKGVFAPFGMGGRQCIGEQFAWAEGVVITATFASRWRFLPVPGVPVTLQAQSALRPSQVPMIVQAR